MEKKEIQFNIDFGKAAFFAENATISHNPSKFVIDFTQVTPRFDQIPGTKEQNFSMFSQHDTIIMDAVSVKKFLNALADNVKKYEEKFGEIKLPKAEVHETPSEKKYTPPSSSYIG